MSYGPVVTQDLSRFGSREFAMAAEMFRYLAEEDPLAFMDYQHEDIRLWFNTDSGVLVLSAMDGGPVWLMAGEDLLKFEICIECGDEFESSSLSEGLCEGCSKEAD